MNIEVTFDDQATDFLLRIDGELENPRGLNAALGARLQDELKDYFFTRNSQPNKRNWPKQNWWARVADATQLTEVSDEGATVTVASREGFYIRLHGGVIQAREAGALTIPAIPEAYGKSAAEFEQSSGIKLFRPAGARYLAFSDDGAESVTLAYFLVPRVTIPADPAALPPIDQLADALQEEGNDYLERSLN